MFLARSSWIAAVAVVVGVVSSCDGSSAVSDRASSGNATSATPKVTSTTAQRDENSPALAIPAGTVACRAGDLEFAPGAGLSLLRFFNRSGRSCGLAGYVTVFGRVATGQWQLVRTTPLDLAPVNGPRWTGVFEPSLTAVLSVRPTPTAECVATSTPTHYTALRLSLPRHAGTIDIDSIDFDAGECPLQLTPFAADSQDN